MRSRPSILRQLAPAACAALFAAFALGGCQSYQADTTLVRLASQGQAGAARERVFRAGLTEDRSDRDFILQRMKMLTLALDDGALEAARPHAELLYDLLRQQGLNDDRTIRTFLFGEGGIRIYKGEPYEQALAYSYIALFDAMEAEWGNVRAASNDALFLLRDFSQATRRSASARASMPSTETDAQVRDRLALIEAAAREDQSARRGSRARASTSAVDTLGIAHAPVASDFELGYALRAIAARRLGEIADSDEALNQLLRIAPRLSPLADAIRAGNYNTVIIAAYGSAPRKDAAGPDGTIAVYRPTTPSDDAPLRVTLSPATGGSSATLSFPVTTDVNRLARDVRWNNLEDMRRAKSFIGDALVLGGGAVAIAAEDDEAKLAGLAAVLAGAAVKASARVDTRHNEVFPQRLYVALVTIPPQGATIDLSIANRPESRLVLPALTPPSDSGELQLFYARLPMVAAPWATSGRVRYLTDSVDVPALHPTLPFILGGRCVRTPSESLMDEYRRAGLPADVTLAQLMDLYRAENIQIADVTGTRRDPGRHILEGGRWIYPITPGTTGFARLLGQDHPPFQPRAEATRVLQARITPSEPASSSRVEPHQQHQAEQPSATGVQP